MSKRIGPRKLIEHGQERNGRKVSVSAMRRDTLHLLGPTKGGGLAVEDDVGGLEGNITEDVDADVSRGLEATVALVAEDGLLKDREKKKSMLAFFSLLFSPW